VVREPGVPIFVVDDHAPFRRAVASLADMSASLTFVGEAADGAEAMRLLAGVDDAVVLVDVNMPGMPGDELVRAIQAHWPHLVPVLVSTYDERELPPDVRDSGVRYLRKEELAPDVLAQIYAR